MDLVSVIIPVYNVEQYLDDCLKSVTSQTYSNVEILLIDDGSTDQSGEKCESWARTDSRIHVIHQENKGLSGARNTGLDKCTGDWITFVDSDDLVANNYVEELLRLAKDVGVKLVQGSQIGIQIDEGENLQRVFDRKNNENAGIKPELMEIYEWTGCSKDFMLSPEYQTMAWGKLYHSDLFAKERFPVGKLHEDNAIVYRIVYFAERVAYTKRILYGYRSRQNSIMGDDGYNLRHLDKQHFLKERLIFFQEHQEMELANLARKEYAFELLESYGKVKKHHPKETEKLSMIHQEYCSVVGDVLKTKDLSIRTKALMMFAKCNPAIWTKVFGEK